MQVTLYLEHYSKHFIFFSQELSSHLFAFFCLLLFIHFCTELGLFLCCCSSLFILSVGSEVPYCQKNPTSFLSSLVRYNLAWDQTFIEVIYFVPLTSTRHFLTTGKKKSWYFLHFLQLENAYGALLDLFFFFFKQGLSVSLASRFFVCIMNIPMFLISPTDCMLLISNTKFNIEVLSIGQKNHSYSAFIIFSAQTVFCQTFPESNILNF